MMESQAAVSETAAGKACLGGGGSGLREMVGAAGRGVREVGQKENWEQEATGAVPLADSTDPCKNPEQLRSYVGRPINLA